MNGLSGPLHGLANQECLRFVLAIKKKYNGVPTRQQITDFAWETLNSGKVIPGYGHPDVLMKHGHAKNPYPNVDAGSGSLLHHFGVTEFDYYTVLFGTSRALGMLSQLVLSRGLGEAIERPKSIQTAWLEKMVSKSSSYVNKKISL